MNSILVGNGINNITQGHSWDNLITKISDFCGVGSRISDEKEKHFPLLYEEIFLTAARKGNISELDLKGFIAKTISYIERNTIHEELMSLKINDIMTTNYDFNLEGIVPEKNAGVIDETLYSVFRHYRSKGKRIWHLHGDVLHPRSINLGFEHYIGQAQQVRNYVATGTSYQSKKINQAPLIRRLQSGKLEGHSWIDLFFTSNVHIIGLNLGFVETELWWLLTYRARMMADKKLKSIIKNKIAYYIPKKYVSSSRAKLDMFDATDVKWIPIDKSGDAYYREVISMIK